jgi:2OG-Fe(II) oxygenase superfamily
VLYIHVTGFAMKDPESIQVNGNNIYTPLFTFNWPGRSMASTSQPEFEKEHPGHFKDVLAFGDKAMDLICKATKSDQSRPLQSDDPKLVAPLHFSPTALRGILYPKDGHLHAHQDMMMGWVLSMTIGQSCDFFFGPHWEEDHKETVHVRLNSGDLILVNGQKLHHGVSKLLDGDGTLPSFWETSESIPTKWKRFNLQMRDPQHIFHR